MFYKCYMGYDRTNIPYRGIKTMFSVFCERFKRIQGPEHSITAEEYKYKAGKGTLTHHFWSSPKCKKFWE